MIFHFLYLFMITCKSIETSLLTFSLLDREEYCAFPGSAQGAWDGKELYWVLYLRVAILLYFFLLSFLHIFL